MTLETIPTQPSTAPATAARSAVTAAAPPDPVAVGSAAEIVRGYAEGVFTRGSQPMIPAGFKPDWVDAPSKYKTYPDVPRLAAPRWSGSRLGRLPELLAASDPGHTDTGDATGPDGSPWRANEVSALAALAYGVRDRRLTPNWNQDLPDRLRFPGAIWGRATTSGGGMYPLEIYWVVGPGSPVRPGVYHYHTGHHAWQQLASGDHTAPVRSACLGAPDAERAGQYLVVTSRFWKNSFKYHNFCLHVVTQDLGALLGSWHLIARGLGHRLRPVLWFADEPINERLGLRTEEESVLAVVPLTGGDPPPQPAALPADDVRAVAFERSRRLLRLDRLIEVHRATLVTEDQPRPATLPAPAEPAQSAASAEQALPLPELPDRRWQADLTEILAQRRSSFGRFSRSRRLDAAELGGILSTTAAARHFPDDLAGPPDRSPLTRLHVLVNDVAGVEAGSYTFDSDAGLLTPHQIAPMTRILQRAYFLKNYNLEQVGAVLAISARFDAAMTHYGPRGYRLVNIEAGAVAQVAYLAAAALGVGCGAVLGLDNEILDEALGLTGTPLRTVLFVLLGYDRADTGTFAYPVLPAAAVPQAGTDTATAGRIS
ncbi:SagB/ThcOx family dehydrogenase [Micromonospora sonneratiae]|uniref:SagB family peptide dehydrogenase n=1 Tax=Micromonospora sonneratiae TaxID=1184706 RepID=A0ABW3Y568_9ACTN